MGSRRTVNLGVQKDNKMPSFIPASNSINAEENTIHSSPASGYASFDQSLQYRIEEAVDLRMNPIFNQMKSTNFAVGCPDVRFGTINKELAPTDINLASVISRSQGLSLEKESQQSLVSPSSGYRENWGESNLADTSPNTSIDDTYDENQRHESGPSAMIMGSDSHGTPKEKKEDQKTLRRLAQNREAARKSRLRKKAYVQQLESSRLKLTSLEQELQRARQQGGFISSSGDQSHSTSGNGAMTFDIEYSRWLEEHNRLINELRTAVNSHAGDAELDTIIDSITSQYDNIYKLKESAGKADVFHILSGMWKTPAERSFMWIGGFRSSEILKLLGSQLEPLTEQQLMSICNLQQSSQQAEDALTQGMEALQQSLAETLASAPTNTGSNVAGYMSQMATAMGKLGSLENFVVQADNLRQQTMQQLHRVLTTRQSARALLSINDYFSRLRALSSLWQARPRD